MKRGVWLVIILSLLLMVLFGAFSESITSVVKKEEPQPLQAGFGSSFELPGLPTQLKIYSIGVDAIVQQVGLNKKGEMGIPTNYVDVAWYKEGPRPGAPGSAVIDGHLDGRNTKEAVFYDLEKLKDGDLVEVLDDKGKIFQFRVYDKKVYNYASSTPEVFTSDGSKMLLNLITCTGDWIAASKIYTQRVVIFTEMVKD